MCVISINVDEVALRDMRPELNSKAAIRKWAQELVNLRILQMELEDTETTSIEEARAMVHAVIHEEYTKP